MRWFLILFLLPVSTMCLQAAPPRVVERVDLKRYIGTWYEIARYPNFFQKGCAGGTTATYELRPDGKITVINRCREKDGGASEARGKAWVADHATNAKLKVQFFWPFRGAYWVIELDPDYRWAVVGHPDRKYLWILSRTPELEPAVYDDILRRIAAQGYDLKPIIKTPQP